MGGSGSQDGFVLVTTMTTSGPSVMGAGRRLTHGGGARHNRKRKKRGRRGGKVAILGHKGGKTWRRKGQNGRAGKVAGAILRGRHHEG